MKGVNLAIIVGHLGNDPETRYAPSGTAITTISVATAEQWADKQSGEKKEKTEWHRIKFFGKLAEIAGEYLRKGSQVYVEGRIETDKYTDKQGVERYATGIIANKMQMLGGKPAGAQSGGGSGTPSGQRQSRMQPPTDEGTDGFDDPIPFITSAGVW